MVLPAATWYEKHDLNTTDMHPFVHSFNPAIAPPWQTRTDWDAWQTIATRFSELAAERARHPHRRGRGPAAARHPDAMANPHGVVRDWKAGECEPVPGVTMPKLVAVERDYAAVGAKMQALGPLMEKLGTTTKGVTYDVNASVDYLRAKNGAVRGGPADGRPESWTCTPARRSWPCPAPPTATSPPRASRPGEKRTGTLLHDLAAEHEGKQITFADTQAAPTP